MSPYQKTQRRIQRLEFEIDRLQRQAVMDRQFLQARNERIEHLKATLAAKRRTLARIGAQDA